MKTNFLGLRAYMLDHVNPETGEKAFIRLVVPSVARITGKIATVMDTFKRIKTWLGVEAKNFEELQKFRPMVTKAKRLARKFKAKCSSLTEFENLLKREEGRLCHSNFQLILWRGGG